MVGGIKSVILGLIVLIAGLQLKLWHGEGSILNAWSLQKEVALQQAFAEKLKERNSTLEAEVQDLKHRLAALEEHARTDLGMIRQGETFYQYLAKNE